MPTRGFTLVEVLVAMGIFSLIIGGITALLLYSFKARDVVWEQLSTQNEGRKIAQDFINELRTAAQSSIGAYALEIAGTSTIVFYSNIDGDSWRERVRYFLDGATLKKGVNKPSGSPLSYNPATEVIIEAVHDVANSATSSLFYYYGESYDGVTDTSSLPYPVSLTLVRVIGIKLILEQDPHLSPAPLEVEGKVEVRNLKTN